MKHRHRHIKNKIKTARPRKLIIQKPVFWIILFLIMLFIGAIYAVFFWPKFQISVVEISGNKKVETEDIQNIALTAISDNLFSKNIFTFDTDTVAKGILNSFPAIADVKPQKNGRKELF